jgi:excisionase family DNA binding protein
MEETKLSFLDLEDWVTPDQARRFLRVSKSTMYELLRSNQIPSRRWGRQLRIPKEVLDPSLK